MKQTRLLPTERIERYILFIRGQKVMLDVHLAELYHVETKTLKRAVRRNQERFPKDFMFELTSEEYAALRYHFGTLKRGNTQNTYRMHSLTGCCNAFKCSVRKELLQ